MINFNSMILRFATKRLSKLIFLTILFCIASGTYYGIKWTQAIHDNQAFMSRAILKQTVRYHDYQHAYAQAYLFESVGDYAQASKLFTLVESSADQVLTSKAKFANANLYADLALKLAQQEGGLERQQAIAQIELARESYKAALRDQPDMVPAKFNLELLDRLSPVKRTQGWAGETDGVTLQPFKKNGTSMMKDNVRRGLP
jgi:tetratricopeptide (TPR) repeat protein